MKKEDAFLKSLTDLRDVFFLELLDNAEMHKNKNLYDFLTKENEKTGFFASLNFLLISEIFFTKIRKFSNEDQISKKVTVKNDSSLEDDNSSFFFWIQPVNFSEKIVIEKKYDFYGHILSKLTFDEKISIELLIDDLSHLNKKEFCLSLIDFLNKTSSDEKIHFNSPKDLKKISKYLTLELNNQDKNISKKSNSSHNDTNYNKNFILIKNKYLFNYQGIWNVKS